MWLDVTLRVGGRAALPSMFAWSAGAATLLFNELNPKYYSVFVKPDRTAEYVCDLATDGLQAAGYADKGKQRFGPTLDDPTLPVREMLRRLTGKESY